MGIPSGWLCPGCYKVLIDCPETHIGISSRRTKEEEIEFSSSRLVTSEIMLRDPEGITVATFCHDKDCFADNLETESCKGILYSTSSLTYACWCTLIKLYPTVKWDLKARLSNYCDAPVKMELERIKYDISKLESVGISPGDIPGKKIG